MIIKRQLLVMCVVVLGVAPVVSQPFAEIAKRRPAPPLNKLRKVDRERLIAAKLQNKKDVMLVLAAKPGMNATLAREATNAGAVVRFREDSVNYLRLKVPVDRIYDIARSRLNCKQRFQSTALPFLNSQASRNLGHLLVE